MSAPQPTTDVTSPPRWFGAVCLLSGLPFFLLGIYFGHPDKGIVATFSVALLVLIGRMHWRNRRRAWFWVALGLAFLLHIDLVSVAHFPEFDRPAILVFAPFVLADFVVMAWVFARLERSDA